MKRQLPVLILLALASAAVLASVLAPYLIEPGTAALPGGKTAFIDNIGKHNEMDAVPGLIYGIGDAVCHQIPSRSICLNGNQMPICARDLCLLAGISAGSAVCILAERAASSKKMITVAAVLFISVIADWIVQYAGGFDSGAMRMITGTAGGFGLAVLICAASYREYDNASPADR